MAAAKPRYYRYSASELLGIATHITAPFDLSALSFTAVRAGIVPALTGSVMAPRTSVAHPHDRGWSQQTTDSSSEQVIFQGSQIEYPLRQPVNSPPGARAQKDEGFAQFLKTHSSPNHNRVTAGGRIVPMEARPIPPSFVLSAPKPGHDTGSSGMQKIESTSKAVTIDANRSTGNDNNVINTKQPGIAENVMAPSNVVNPQQPDIFGHIIASNHELGPQTTMPTPEPPGNSTIHQQQAALDSNIMMQNQLFSYRQQWSNSVFHPTFPGVASQVPAFGQQYPASVPYLPHAASFVQPGIANSTLSMYRDFQTQLTRANSKFEYYHHQLRDHDRYCAMHQSNESLVRHRMDIVTRRAEAQAEIRRLEAMLDQHERDHGLTTVASQLGPPGPPQQHKKQQRKARRPLTIRKPHSSNDPTPKTRSTSKLNVAAPAYVPKSVYNPSSAFKWQPNAPKLPATQRTRMVTRGSQTYEVDAWGERIGMPPPELLREQTLMAEYILNELSKKSHAFDDDAGKNDLGGDGLPRQSAGCWPPNATAAQYGRPIDTMRKPHEFQSPVNLPHGQMHGISGVGLQAPAAENMIDHQRAYWNHKPRYLENAPYGNDENSLVTKTSTLSFAGSVMSQDQVKACGGSLQDSPSRQVLSDLRSTIGYNKTPTPTHSHQDAWDAATGRLQTQAGSEASISIGHHHGIRPGADNYSLGQEALLNKTFSSTALQDVHATAILPRSLDGAVEAKFRQVKASTPETKSPKSPKSPRSPFFAGFRRVFYTSK